MIELDGVGYGYGGQPLLHDISLSLAPGEFAVLTGPSGAGKTTLLRLCHGELLPGAGAVRLFGQETRALDRDAMALVRRRIGVVHQDARFLDHLDLAQNIALPLAVAGRQAEAAENLPDLLKWVGLTARAGQRPPELSGGERQRAALARAVVTSPDAILADEPTGNVDWEMSERLMRLLVELNRMGKTVLLATHDLALLRSLKAQVALRVLRLKDGALTEAGSAW